MNIEHLVIPIHKAPDMSGMSPSKVYQKRILPGGEPTDRMENWRQYISY